MAGKVLPQKPGVSVLLFCIGRLKSRQQRHKIGLRRLNAGSAVRQAKS
jgi:hypothetical protein